MTRVVGGRYELLKKLGAGGMGAVYLARHTATLGRCALKLIHDHAEDGNSHARFLREARAPAEIGHPGIVQVLDAGVDTDGTMFVAMELLSGQSYRGVLQRTDATLDEKVGLLLEALEPLAVAHRKGFVHRDLKPENLFVVSHALGGQRMKLLDFGIARDGGAAELTETGVLVGSVKYVAPEQARSARDASPASDVWSMGVMLYEVAFGDVPFAGSSSFDVLVKIHAGKFTPLRERMPDLPVAYEALVHRCLSQEPNERPRDAAELADALAPILDAGLPDHSTSWRPVDRASSASERRRARDEADSRSRPRTGEAPRVDSPRPEAPRPETSREAHESSRTESSPRAEAPRVEPSRPESRESSVPRASRPDLSWLTPKPTQRRAKGITIIPLLRHLHMSLRSGKKLALTARDEALLGQRLIVSDWYPFAIWMRLIELQAEVADHDLTVAVELGRQGALELIGSVHRSFVSVGDPGRTLRALSRMWSRYFDFGEVDVADRGTDGAVITLVGYSDMPPWYAHMVAGWIVGLVELAGAKVATHTIEEFPWKDDGRYRLLVRWRS